MESNRPPDDRSSFSSPETEALRQQIEQTRDGMSQTIDEIQSRLTPSHLAGQAVNAAKSAAQDAASGAAEHVVSAAQTATNATVEALTQLLTTLRNSPQFMAALPGLIAALLHSGRSAVEGAEQGVQQGVQQGVERAGEQARNASTATMEAASALWESIRQNPALMGALVSGLTWLLAQGTTAMTKMGQAREKAADVAGQASETAGALTEQARETAGELGAQAQQQTQRAAGWLQRVVEQNPLAVALAAVAIGAVIGLSSKPTQLEQQVMGPARDRMLEQAQTLAKDAAKGLATTAAATAATAMVAHAASNSASNSASQAAPPSTEEDA